MKLFRITSKVADVRAIRKGKVVKRAVRKRAIRSVIRWTR